MKLPLLAISLLSGLAATAALPSCVDLAPNQVPRVRFLSVPAESSSADSGGVAVDEPRLWIGRVTSSDAISERLLTRRSEYEVTYDDFVRWAEPPVVYLERALDEGLFRSGPFVRDERGGRRLDVELLKFEERFTPRHAGAIEIVVRVVDPDGAVVLDRRIQSAADVDGEDPALVAEALTDALRDAVRQVTERLRLL